jgi:hypothetical protein
MWRDRGHALRVLLLESVSSRWRRDQLVSEATRFYVIPSQCTRDQTCDEMSIELASMSNLLLMLAYTNIDQHL